MPLVFLGKKVIAETKNMPFVGFSVLIFWVVTMTVVSGLWYTYPKLVQAVELKEDFQRLESRFLRSRLEDKIADIDTETLKLERERERVRSLGEPVPDVYAEQLQRLRRERAVFMEQLLRMIRKEGGD